MLGPAPRVFLSYARKDGEAFATALRHRLATEQPEITLWQDRAELEGGAGWWTQIEAALDQVKFLVIVITPRAMTSEITRREWRYARQKGVIVYPVKGVPDDQLDYAAIPPWMRKAHFFDIGQWTGWRWKNVKEWGTFTHYLKSDREPVRVPFLAPDMPPSFVPRPTQFDAIRDQVLASAAKEPVAITTALQGAGGYGKTTLAIALCHDERVREAFYDGVLWTSLGQTPSIVDELARWYEALTGQRPAFIDETDAATKLAQKLEHRSCLLVIDDVWERRHLEPFLSAGKHSARLITTRRFDLVDGKARIRVDEMTADQAVRMLAAPFDVAAVPPSRLAPLTRQVGEWPLLLTLVAGMIRQRVLLGDAAEGALTYVERALQTRGVTAFDRTDGAQRVEAVRRTVAASLDQLSPEDQRRFQELAIFPEETAVPLTTLACLWDLDDLDTTDCAQRLNEVSLVSLDLRRGVVTLHDAMRAYLRPARQDLDAVHTRLVAGYGDPHQLPDAYAWRWLPYHLVEAGQADQLGALLLTPTWLEAQLRAVGPHVVIQDFRWLPDDRDLDIVHAALRLSLPALASDASQLWEQLWGRLPDGASARLDALRGSLARLAPTPRLHARWANLQGSAGALVQTLSHGSDVHGALMLPDGRVLSWSQDGTLRAWNLATGEGRPLTGHEESVGGALTLPDGRVLSWSDDQTLRLWDLATGEGRPLTGHKASVTGAAWLPDGRVLSWSWDHTLRVWNLATDESRPLTGHEWMVHGALALPDGRMLSWSGDHTLRVWDLMTGESHPLTGHEQTVDGALVLLDGRVLSWGADHTLRVWDLATGKDRPLAGHEGPVLGALVLPGGRVLSWSGDQTLRVWDLATGAGRPLTGHEGPVLGALPLRDGRVLSWSWDQTLRVWDLATGESHLLRGHEGAIRGALPLPEGRLLSWSDDGTLRVWDLPTGTARPLRGHDDRVLGALLLPNGRVLSWSSDRTLRVWDRATRDGRPLTGHERWVRGALLLPDGRVLSWSDDRTLRIWNLLTGAGRPLTGHEASVAGAQPLSDGRVLSWSDDRTLRVWDLATGASRPLTGHKNAVGGALVLPDGRVLSWSGDRTLRVWDLTTGASRPLTGHERSVTGALVLPDGRVLSWSEDGTLRVWAPEMGQRRVLTGHEGPVNGAHVLADGRVLSWSWDHTLRVWDVATGQRRALAGHEGPVNGALVLADGRVLSWSSDDTLRIWDLASGGCALKRYDEPVTSARVLLDGRVLSWSENGTLRVWDLTSGEARLLNSHQGEVYGALALPDGRVLSWSNDRTVRLQTLDGTDVALTFTLDATPTVVFPTGPDQIWVGDGLGRVHILELLKAPS